MSKLKYKVGDKVRIKGIGWYNENKDERDDIECSNNIWFYRDMSKFCGKVMTISHVGVDYYTMVEDLVGYWTDEMIEGLVEEEALKQYEVPTGSIKIWDLPEGYIFKDERGNEIHDPKIVLEKANTLKIQRDNMETETHRGYCTTEEETTNESKKVALFTFWDNDFADKVELDLSNRELIQEDGKWFVVKKKKEYPKTYEECLSVLEIYNGLPDVEIYNAKPSECKLFESFIRLKRCRDAYWKLYGEEMGLNKPWEPSQYEMVYTIYRHSNKIGTEMFLGKSVTFEFPTAEMRDSFKNNFDPDIEFCKELL